MKLKPLILVLTMLACLNINLSAQVPEEWFGLDYTDALKQCSKEKDWIVLVLSNNNIPYKISLSVAFPEMLRYSPTRNIVETSALKMLYVTEGNTHANFSIGWMQMKPSFIEKLEELIKKDSKLIIKYRDLVTYKSSKQKEIRRERVKRLDDFFWQLKYLSAFVDVQNNRFAISKLPEKEMIKVLATSYNYGLDKTYKDIIEYAPKKNFPNGAGKSPYSYSMLSEYFYLNNADGIFKNK